MLRTGLTGGTGSGKSTVARRLAERGAVVVDADALAREVVAPGTDGLAPSWREFGPQVVAPDGGLDRAALAAVVFADPARRKALEAITHPRIARRTGELVAAAPPDTVLVHDVPLLVEKRMGPGYHLVVVVDAPVEDRVRRLVGRGMPEDDARRRITSQAGDEERRAAADVWLTNEAGTDELHEAVDRLWADRLVPFRDNLSAGRPAPAAGGADGADREGAARRLLERVRLALGERAGAVELADGTGGDDAVLLRCAVRTGPVDASWDEPLLRAGVAPLDRQDPDGRGLRLVRPGPAGRAPPAARLTRVARSDVRPPSRASPG